MHFARVRNSLKIASPPSLSVRAGTPSLPHPRERYTFFEVPASLGICRRIMLLKGTAVAGWEAGLVERRFRGTAENVQAARTRVDLFLGTASRLFLPSLRNQAVHHVSPFFHPLLAESRPTHEKRIQDDSKQIDVRWRNMIFNKNLQI